MGGKTTVKPINLAKKAKTVNVYDEIGKYFYSQEGGLPKTPASLKDAISESILTPASIMWIAKAKPVPSPKHNPTAKKF